MNNLHTCPKHGVEFCCNIPEDIHHACSKGDLTITWTETPEEKANSKITTMIPNRVYEV